MYDKEAHNFPRICSIEGRPVAVQNFIAINGPVFIYGVEVSTCQLCGKTSTLLITEIANRKLENPIVWGWCGECGVA
jgi:hypothetical protein